MKFFEMCQKRSNDLCEEKLTGEGVGLGIFRQKSKANNHYSNRDD